MMEDYKKKLKARRVRSCVLVLVAVCLVTAHILYLLDFAKDDTGGFNDGFLIGFQFGLIIAIGVLAIIEVFKLSRTLKDEHKIKLMYNEEHDERMASIRAKCGHPLIQSLCMVIVIVAIVVGYFNFTIFYTLVVIVIFELFVSLGLKLYYTKKM